MNGNLSNPRDSSIDGGQEMADSGTVLCPMDGTDRSQQVASDKPAPDSNSRSSCGSPHAFVSLPNQAGGHTSRQSYNQSIFLLPQELLFKIIAITTLSGVTPSERQTTLLSLSQVSRWWRQSAFECKPLWAQCIDYNDDSLDWIDELLQRSSPSLIDFGTFARPIRLEAEWRYPTEQTLILKRVLRDIQRIRVFSYDSGEDSHWEIVSSSFHRRHLPHLEEINFFRECIPSVLIDHPPIAINAPCLHSISTSRLPIDCSPLPALPNLLDLRVVADGLKMDFGRWLDLLRHLPNLRWLSIWDGFLEGPPPPTTTRVCLNQLQMVTLAGSITACLDFLDLLLLPPECALRFELIEEILSPIEKHRMSRFIDATFKDRKEFPGKLAIRYSTYQEVAQLEEIDLSVSSESLVDESGIYTPPNPSISMPLISIGLHNDFVDLPVFFGLFRLLPTDYTNVTELEILFDRELDPDEYPSLTEELIHFGNLTSLQINGFTDTVLLPVLRHWQSTESPLFPSLRSVTFKEPGSCSIYRSDTIKDFFDWRSQIGFGIDTVSVTNIGFDAQKRAENFLGYSGFDKKDGAFDRTTIISRGSGIYNDSIICHLTQSMRTR